MRLFLLLLCNAQQRLFVLHSHQRLEAQNTGSAKSLGPTHKNSAGTLHALLALEHLVKTNLSDAPSPSKIFNTFWQFRTKPMLRAILSCQLRKEDTDKFFGSLDESMYSSSLSSHTTLLHQSHQNRTFSVEQMNWTVA